MMLRRKCVFLMFFVTLSIMAVNQYAMATDEIDDEAGLRKYGVVHNVAEDRKVEKVGGIYEPEGLAKYIKRRLDEVTNRLDRMTAELQLLNQKLDKVDTQPEDAKKQ